MTNYLFVYYNGADATDMGTASRDDIMSAWKAWFGEIGESLVDGGNPFNFNGRAVDKSGVKDVGEWPATGYSVVKADSMEAAVEIAKGCPSLKDNGPAGATVRVYETVPM